MSFPRYPKYKDSGVEWLGEVPEHWTALPIKRLGRLKAGTAFPHDRQGIEGEELSFHKVSALAQADRNGFLLPSENTISRDVAKELGAFVFPCGTIVFAKVGAALLLGRIRVLKLAACLDNNMMGLVVHQNEASVDFLRHAMTLVRFDLIANPGAVPSLNEGQIGDFRLAIPPLSEQSAIAAFLDRETTKIDALIAEQQRLIELLKEKRQAIISHAVTKGLDPDVPMKDSGIEWLGEVPAHWEITKIKHLVRSIEQGWSPQCEGFPVGSEAEWGVLKVGCVNGGTFNPAENKLLPKELEAIPELAISSGDLLISRANTRELVGSVAVAERNYPNLLLCDKLYRVRFEPERCSPKFACRYLGSTNVRGQIELAATGASSSMLNIGQSAILELSIAIPTIEEQCEIVGYLDRHLAEFDTLTAEAQRAIDLLQERRTALISAAVTGQIDVRQQAA